VDQPKRLPACPRADWDVGTMFVDRSGIRTDHRSRMGTVHSTESMNSPLGEGDSMILRWQRDGTYPAAGIARDKGLEWDRTERGSVEHAGGVEWAGEGREGTLIAHTAHRVTMS
jgi:hypothetical protein